MTSYTGYCNIDLIKDRLLINEGTYDTGLEAAGDEASRLVDIFLKPYTTVPLTTVDDQIEIITADFAASIFKRRMMPESPKITNQLTPEGLNQIEATGWFAQGIKKIQEYIKSYYTLAQIVGNSAHNPAIYTQLFKNGLITAKEARAFINASTTIYQNEVNKIISTRCEKGYKEQENVLTDTETKTLTESIVKTLGQTDTIVQDITKTEHLIPTIEKTETDILHETATIAKTITENIERITSDAPTEHAVKTLEQSDTKTLTDTKTIADTITKGETLTKLQTDTVHETKTLSDTKTESETATKVLTDTKTVTEDALITRNKKNKSFVFVESDENGGYKEQGI